MNKQAKERLTVTVPPEVLKAVQEQARVEKRNLSNMTAVLLERGLKVKAA